MSIIIAHPTGNEFFRAAVRGFYDAGQLQSVYTCAASFPGTLLYKLGAFGPFQDIQRRALNNALKKITHTHPWKELGRLLAIKTGRKKWLTHETGMFSIDQVYQDLDRHVARKLQQERAKGATTVYAYEDGAACTFKKAKELGMQNVYDLPIGYWRSMHNFLALEKEVNPQWAVTLDGLRNSLAKLARKDEELALADDIIVASSFTAETLKTYPYTLPKIHTVPYGFPPAREKVYRSISKDDKIRMLFVGGLSQRKGLSYLFAAMKGFEHKITLTIVGRSATGNSKILNDNLAKHTWIETLSHAVILDLMQQNDVLVFPSLFEGFGLVITEAMAQGTPVITTERTAGPDLIQHGENGWIVKAGDTQALQAILNKIADDPGIFELVGKKALETARQRPWSIYEKELVAATTNFT